MTNFDCHCQNNSKSSHGCKAEHYGIDKDGIGREEIDEEAEVCTVEIRGTADSEEGNHGNMAACCGAVLRLSVFLCVVMLVTLGHEGYMMYTQIQIQQVG